MANIVQKFLRHNKFWFYLRKAIFQGLLPVILAFITFIDVAKNGSTNNPNNKSYSHLYFYTAFILFLYSTIKIVLEFIFAISSDNVIFRKEMNLTNTMSLNLANSISDSHTIIVIRKIFKLRYSDNKLFILIDKLCLFMGMDSPVLIPLEIVQKFINTNESIDISNLSDNQTETELLHRTLDQLSSYQVTSYKNLDHTLIPKQYPTFIESLRTPLIKVSVGLDQSIDVIQKDLFSL